MPTDYSIAIRPGSGQPKRREVPGVRRQPMRGYEDRYTDIVDYVVGITERIWEDQDVGCVYDTYSPGVRLHDDFGWRFGVEGVVEGTIASINAFADVRSYADDVIWAGDEDAGFVTSHRALNTGHHTGPWRWGAPTGRPVSLWVIANCLSRENTIYEEWVLYNEAGRLAQLGYDVAACARRHADAGGLGTLGERQRGEVEHLIGGRRPERYRADDHPGRPDVEHLLRAVFLDTYDRRDLSAIDRAYAPDVRWHGTSGREGHGRYGAPTGRRVFLWGISQLHVSRGRVVEEWALFNEFAVLAQLLAPEPVDLLA